jgi:Protein kinase domain
MTWLPISHVEVALAGQGRLLVDRYRLGEPIAAGSAGTVFAGCDERTQVEVIIKFFDGDSDPFRPWMDEARSALRLRHPNVVACHNLGWDTETGLHFLVLDRAFGGSLRRAMVVAASPAAPEGSRCFPPSEVREVLADVARGLDYCHQHGVVHRDVKPENIVAGHVTGLRPWLITDFGSSRFVAGGTRAQSIVGSAQYIAPEVIDHDATAACDQYSLGVTALELLTGVRPSPASRAAFLLEQRTIIAAHADLELRGRRGTRWVCALIAAMIQPDRSRRLPCMSAVLDVLDADREFATTSLADGTVVGWIGESVIFADRDQRCAARMVRVPRGRGLVNHRGAQRVVIASDRRLVAVAPTGAMETLFASDRGFSCLAVCERNQRIALRRDQAAELEIIGIEDGAVETVVALPEELRDLPLRAVFARDGRLAVFSSELPQLMFVSGGGWTSMALETPVREVYEGDDDIAVLTGGLDAASVRWLGSGERQDFSASVDRVAMDRTGARLIVEALDQLALEVS